MVKHIGASRKVVEVSTGNVYLVDFIVDSGSSFGFQMIVTKQYRDRDIVCENKQKVFRPEEISFLDDITTESWYKILEQLRKLES